MLLIPAHSRHQLDIDPRTLIQALKNTQDSPVSRRSIISITAKNTENKTIFIMFFQTACGLCVLYFFFTLFFPHLFSQHP